MYLGNAFYDVKGFTRIRRNCAKLYIVKCEVFVSYRRRYEDSCTNPN